MQEDGLRPRCLGQPGANHQDDEDSSKGGLERKVNRRNGNKRC